MSDSDVPLCPSAPAATAGARVFGVVGGTVAEPRISYLKEPVPAAPDVLALAAPVSPEEVFRIAAPCAGSGCRHFADGQCTLGERLVAVDIGPPDDDHRLPRCAIRSRCRWWQERGPDACRRCPLVVSREFAGTEAMLVASGADPIRTTSPTEPSGRRG